MLGAVVVFILGRDEDFIAFENLKNIESSNHSSLIDLLHLIRVLNISHLPNY